MASKHPERTPLVTRPGLPASNLVDVVEREGRLYVKVELPGVRAGEIDVRISDGLLDLCAQREARAACCAGRRSDPFDEIIGSSQTLIACLGVLRQAAASEASVLLCGETGTGKELCARAIHQHSARSQGNFVTVDCTVLPEALVGNLLFGHEKGSFTGADRNCAGLIREAHRGTLFLDEVGELSQPLQKAFLRVLQEHRFRPTGHHAEVESDFRLVAATNRDLPQSVARGQFRADLLYRLQPCLITLPALRSRSEDIPQLARHFVDRLCARHGFRPKLLSPELIRTLTLYPWPGNVRELINTLEQTLFMAPQEPTLFARHLPQHLRIRVARAALEAPRSSDVKHSAGGPGRLPCLQEFRSEVFCLAERQYLSSLVQHTGQNVRQACRLSGLSRSRLYSLLKKHRISLH